MRDVKAQYNDLTEIIEALTKERDEGKALSAFVVTFGPAHSYNAFYAGNVLDLAASASILQAEFTRHHYGNL